MKMTLTQSIFLKKTVFIPFIFQDGSLDCIYTLQLNVTSLVTSEVQQILANDTIDVTLHQDTAMFK